MEAQRIFWLLGMVMACSGQLIGAKPRPSCTCDSGREFVALNQGEFMVVRTGSDQTVSVDIHYNGNNHQEILDLQLGEAAKLPIQKSEDGTCQTIVIRTNSDIAVIARDSEGNTASVPPVNALGTRYIVTAPPPGGTKKLFLTALNHSMIVSILGKGLQRINGEEVIHAEATFRTIKPFENVVMENKFDLNGFVEITSNRNGSLAGGCAGKDCAAIYENFRASDCFGDSVFAPALPYDPSEVTLTVAASVESVVLVRSAEGTRIEAVDVDKPLRIHPSSPVSITGLIGIQVMLALGKGQDNCLFEIPVQDTSQFCRQYKTFINPSFTNMITLTCKANSCPQITINGKVPKGITWLKYEGTDFCSGTYTLDAGSSSYTIEHPTETFGLLTLGRVGNKTYSAASICMSGSCYAASSEAGGPPSP